MELLTARVGERAWIAQVAYAAKVAVQNGLNNFGESADQLTNTGPNDEYRFPARTREELIRDAALAADSRHVGEQARPRDPLATPPKETKTDERHDNGSVPWLL